jgi:hypothetical protein
MNAQPDRLQAAATRRVEQIPLSGPKRQLTDSAPVEGAAVRKGAKLYQLGILFVHGVGSQPAGETLVKWGDVLLKTIQRGTRNRVKPQVVEARIASENGERPHAVVAFSAEEKWLIADGWWAEVFPAPSYAELVSWSVRALPWSITLHFAHRYWTTTNEAASRIKVLRATVMVGQLLLGLALAPVVVGILLLTLLLGWLPIAQLRGLLLNVQSTLTATIGDSLVLVESPFRAALIRTRIQEGIRHLGAACERTIIVAHSQGAAVVLDAMGGITEPFDKESDISNASIDATNIDTLVTFGAGTNQLVSLKVIASDSFEKESASNAVYLALIALFGVAATVGWIGYHLYTNQISILSLGHVAILFLITTVLGTAVGLCIKKGAQKLNGTLGQKNADRAASITIISICLASLLILGAYVYLGRSNAIFGAFNGLIVAVLMLGSSVIVIMSKSLKEIVTAPVQKPRALGRWIDISASADPVSNGITRVRNAGAHEYHEIWNEGSLVNDHTTYWENIEGFVLRIARECAETARSPWSTQLMAGQPVFAARARWRVELLVLARLCTGITWMFVLGFFYLWGEFPFPLEFPAWMSAEILHIAQWASLTAFISLIIWILFSLQRRTWRFWVRWEEKEILKGRRPDSGSFTLALCLFMIPFVFPVLLLQSLDVTPTDISWLTWKQTGEIIILAFSLAAVPAALWAWKKRPPDWPKAASLETKP